MQPKAVALISGGLDSLLAAKVVLDQGVAVEGINFYTGFCVEGHTSALRHRDETRPRRNNALWVAEQLGIKLHIIDIAEEYKSIVLGPKFGYGQHLNPCLDCKIFMVGRARTWANENGFDFIVTGEVIGQRPKSQRKNAMPLIARESGANDRLLRPLCAKNLPETLPEREGWVNREDLLAFHGRDRKPQIELANKYGFKDYAQPAGGCCALTNEHFTAKLSDLWDSRGVRDYTLDDVLLLKIGRHIRQAAHFKLIISREESEAFYLEGYHKTFITLRTLGGPGPTALIDGAPTEEDIYLAAQIVARYGFGRGTEAVTISVEHPVEHPLEQRRVANPADALGVNGAFSGSSLVLHVQPLAAERMPAAWHV